MNSVMLAGLRSLPGFPVFWNIANNNNDNSVKHYRLKESFIQLKEEEEETINNITEKHYGV